MSEEGFNYPLLRGYLVKQETGGTHGWTKKWYQNSYENPLILECFSNEKSIKSSSKIDFNEVSDLRIVKAKSSDGVMRYGFQYKCGKQVHKMLSEGQEEGEYWKAGFYALYRASHNGGKAVKQNTKAKDNQSNIYGLEQGEDFGAAIVDFSSSDAGVLSFKKDDKMIILDKPNNGWLPVEFGGKRGWVPSEFVKPLNMNK